MQSFRSIFSISFICLLTLQACDSNRYFEENRELKDHEWFANQPVIFTVDISDTVQTYNVYINVRNAGYYRFSNLFLFINTHLPLGQLQRDTLECILATPDGKWTGDGLGDIWDNRIPFKMNVRFPEPGEYKFEFIQAMRVDPLEGIMDAGIRIERSAN